MDSTVDRAATTSLLILGKCFMLVEIISSVSFMSTSIMLKAENPEEQKAINEILVTLRRKFPTAKVNVVPESKKLLPEEIILLIAIQVSGDVIVRLLDSLWNYLKNIHIEVTLDSVDHVQEKAEEYLRHKGIQDFSIVKRDDKGLYVNLVYRSKRHTHWFSVSRSDCAVLKYEEKNL